MKSFWLFLTFPLTMLIWKPSSFYTSCQVLTKKYLFFSEENNFQSFFRRSKKIKNKFLDSGSTFSISVMNLSISIFSTFLKNTFENYSTKILPTTIFDKNISDEDIWRKFSDENMSTKYFGREYFDNIFQTKIFLGGEGGERDKDKETFLGASGIFW